tara:strand:+ start:5551 stop:6612 length:1062 start_codon:yes stop_codon:yes gene_type:complete
MYRVLTFFLIKLSVLGYCQNIQICLSDNLEYFSATPSLSTNNLEWEFIYGDGAEIINGQFTDNIAVKFTNTGNYILQFREFGSNNCFAVVEMNIIVNPNPLADFTSNGICIYDSVKFINTSISSDGLQSSIWRIGDNIIDAIDLNYQFNQEGEYLIELSVTDNLGCTDIESLFFKLSDRPIANFYYVPENVTTLNPMVEFFNLSSSGNVIWDFDDDFYSDEWEPIHYFDSAGLYDIQLTLEDENGCKDSTNNSLLVINELIFYLPTSFTPDGNGLNDDFGLKGYNIDRFKEFSMVITNRWGEIIYSVNNINQKWNGNNLAGNKAMSGTYLWTINITDELGKQTKHIGEVTLVR